MEWQSAADRQVTLLHSVQDTLETLVQLQNNNNKILLRLVQKNEEEYDSVRKKHLDLAKILVKISEQQVQIVSTIKGLNTTENDGEVCFSK